MVLLESAIGTYPYDLPPQDMNMWNLKNKIEKEPSPELPECFSKQFKDFIRIILNKNSGERGTAKQLQEHPWIIRSSNIPKSIFVEWLKGYKKNKKKQENDK